MEKKTISVHAFTVHMYTIAIILLLALCVLLGLKYLHLKMALVGYTQSTIWMNSQDRPNGRVSDYGLIISRTASKYVAGDKMEEYVQNVSKDLGRDVVIMDRNKNVIADTVSKNVGSVYSLDLGNQINQTIADGQIRSFEERSEDYPNGLVEIVVPMRDSKNQINGVVLVSSSQL